MLIGYLAEKDTLQKKTEMWTVPAAKRIVGGVLIVADGGAAKRQRDR